MAKFRFRDARTTRYSTPALDLCPPRIAPSLARIASRPRLRTPRACVTCWRLTCHERPVTHHLLYPEQLAPFVPFHPFHLPILRTINSQPLAHPRSPCLLFFSPSTGPTVHPAIYNQGYTTKAQLAQLSHIHTCMCSVQQLSSSSAFHPLSHPKRLSSSDKA